ncbi:hypothetical protein CMsap09_09840 [Clavibacter michiganensis]|uniref:Uncharacterized protein n=1 Tax=Clavibacter michiganensis TaxID=28447 RepID=A0A251XUR9_9MICO|nr:hypothetical protein CMsap09_09840 [Clavibacter michiganensis]
MMVFRMISEGFRVSALAASTASNSSWTSSTYSPDLFQSTCCTCQP